MVHPGCSGIQQEQYTEILDEYFTVLPLLLLLTRKVRILLDACDSSWYKPLSDGEASTGVSFIPVQP